MFQSSESTVQRGEALRIVAGGRREHQEQLGRGGCALGPSIECSHQITILPSWSHLETPDR